MHMWYTIQLKSDNKLWVFSRNRWPDLDLLLKYVHINMGSNFSNKMYFFNWDSRSSPVWSNSIIWTSQNSQCPPLVMTWSKRISECFRALCYGSVRFCHLTPTDPSGICKTEIWKVRMSDNTLSQNKNNSSWSFLQHCRTLHKGGGTRQLC